MYKNYCIPEGVEVLEGGAFLVVDTRETGEPPGALQRLDGNDITLDCR